MGSVNEFNPKIDTTVHVFDNFYNFSQEVDANTFDVVNSFMETVFKTKNAALNFTTTLFRVAQETGVPVLTILKQIQGMDHITLNVTLAYYLNSLRSPSTLLGVNAVAAPNYWTPRNVLS